MKKLFLFIFFILSCSNGYDGIIKIEYDLNDNKEIIGEIFYAYDENNEDTFTGVSLNYSAETPAEVKEGAREKALSFARRCGDATATCELNFFVVAEDGYYKLILK